MQAWLTRVLTVNAWQRIRFRLVLVVMYENSFLSVASIDTNVTSVMGASLMVSLISITTSVSLMLFNAISGRLTLVLASKMYTPFVDTVSCTCLAGCLRD